MSNLAHTVQRSILLDAPPERVWEALTDETPLARLRLALGRLVLA